MKPSRIVTLTVVLDAPYGATEDEIITEATLALESGSLHVEFLSCREGVSEAAHALGAEVSP